MIDERHGWHLITMQIVSGHDTEIGLAPNLHLCAVIAAAECSLLSETVAYLSRGVAILIERTIIVIYASRGRRFLSVDEE